ncbi:MAG: hypothetical protein V3R29_08600 [Candidatus Acidoferrales bacterium]
MMAATARTKTNSLAAPTFLSVLLAGSALLFLLALPADAEEFYLKDGTKLVGKIVGYQDGAFRVETSFGIAIIYRDRIARIVFSESPRREQTQPTAEETPTPPEEPEPGTTASTPPQPAETARAKREKPRRTQPPPPEPPQQIIEHLTPTRYVNETFRFHLYKPPTWRSYPQLVQPGTPLVAVLGTPDETTLMLIGRESFNGDLASYARLAEDSLRRTYEDYRSQGEGATTVAGLPGVERSFTGQAEGRFWSGTALYFARGRQYYTVLGLTVAGETTPLQQAVLRTVMNSLTFYE